MNSESSKNIPRSIWHSLILLGVSLLIAVVYAMIEITNYRSAFDIQKASIASIIILLKLMFFAFLGFKIFQGKNWARYIFLALCILGLVTSLLQYSNLLSLVYLEKSLSFLNLNLMGYLMLFQTFLQGATVYLLMNKSSRAYFKKTETA